LFKALHEAINACDQILTAKNDTAIPQMTQARPGRREVVQDVLRSHIQEFLRLLNRDDDRSSDTDPDWNTNVFPATYRRQESVGDIHEASPEERQDKFMAFYFSTIRPNVSARSSRATDRRSAASATHTGHIFPHVGFSRAKRWADGSGPPSPGLSTIDPSTGSREQVPPTEAVACQPVEEVSHDAVWCTLIFRIICWLMLHDFDRSDVQVSKTELLGSRMSVYISLYLCWSFGRDCVLVDMGALL
jgi:hypothetical protein